MKNLFLFVFTIYSFHFTNAQTVGVLQHHPEAYEGYNLFNPSSSTTTYLVNNCGELINSWNSTYNPGLAIYLQEDGNLLRTTRIANSTFTGGGSGGGFEILDWDSNVVFSFPYSSSTVQQHHDVEVLPNGNVLVLAWELKTNAEAIAAGRDPNLLQNTNLFPEHIIEVVTSGVGGGTIVWEWHLWDHLVQDFDPSKDNYGVVAEHPELMDINYALGNGPADWIHANGIDYNEELDQIVISSRSMSEIWIIDHSTTTAEAASHSGGNSGKGGDILYRWGNPEVYDQGTAADQQLFNQHNATWIPKNYPDEGKIMVFSNIHTDMSGQNFSKVVVIDPPVDALGNYSYTSGQAYLPAAPFWEYTASNPPDFFSPNISGAQRLRNGNTLICEGAPGRAFEVAANKEICWEYECPANGNGGINQGNNPLGNSMFRLERYYADFPGFIGKDLTPGLPVENNPILPSCPDFCVNDYTGANILQGNATSETDYETDFAIESTQFVDDWKILDYDAGDYVTLLPGFEAKAGCEMSVFIDGCSGGGGTINPLLKEDNLYAQKSFSEEKNTFLNKKEPQIFPNPTTNNIHLNLPQNTTHQIIVFDTMGKIIEEFKTSSSSETISLGHLPKGNYFIKMSNNTQSWVKMVGVID